LKDRHDPTTQEPRDSPTTFSRESLFLGRVGGSRTATIVATRPVGPISCDCWKIGYITAGSAALQVDGTSSRHVIAGDLVVLRRGAVYTLKPIVPMAVTIVYVDSVFLATRLSWLLRQPENFAVIRSLLEQRTSRWVFKPTPDQVFRVRETFTAVAHPPINQSAQNDPANTAFHDLARLLDVLDIVRAIAGASAPTATRATPGPRRGRGSRGRSEVLSAARLLHTRLAEHWTLASLAQAVNLSPSHLSALFRAHFGSSPMSYLLELRLQRFAYLLVTTDLSIAEAALRSGWRDTSYAGRLCRRRFGTSPTEYRATTTPYSELPAAQTDDDRK